MDCRSFDEQLVRHDKQISAQMDQFVGVRLVRGNVMDLTLFQFDYDLTFAAFFLNADRTLYGRFGTRSSMKDSDRDITVEGFGKALAAALELHRGYPANKSLLAGKQPRPTPYNVPTDFPALAAKYKPSLDDAKPVQSCIHCHQVGDALRQVHRDNRQPIPDDLLIPWPMPDVLGLVLTSKERAGVASVTPGSVAAKAGFRAGDQISSLAGQPLLSIADVQWILHTTKSPATLKAEVVRGGKKVNLDLPLAANWRLQADMAWRPTGWDLRRMTTGGLRMADMTDADRQTRGLAKDALALVINHVGQYNEHAAAKRAGFQKDDVITSIDGQAPRLTESQFMVLMGQTRKKGDKLPVTVLRGAERVQLQLPQQ